MLNVTLLFSTVPKLVLLGLFIKLNFTVFSVKTSGTNLLLLVGGLGSICFASVAALYQKRIKRLIAYSTVSHTGFLVLSVYCLTVDSAKASIIYILLYIMMSLALFSILIISSSNGNNQKYIIN
jgi:NADH:ubiquinone oxidoreductase subunit 2 (subunit N)